MADADLDVVIRSIAKQQNKSLLAAVKSRRDHYAALAAKAKTADVRDRYKQMAKDALLHGTAAAKRLLISADNAADSYARSVRLAAESAPAKKAPAVKKSPAQKDAPAKKTAKKKKA